MYIIQWFYFYQYLFLFFLVYDKFDNLHLNHNQIYIHWIYLNDVLKLFGSFLYNAPFETKAICVIYYFCQFVARVDFKNGNG